MPTGPGGSRLRRGLSFALLALAAVLLPLGLVAAWAHSTLYDSSTFSKRSVDLLNADAVRHFVAGELTDQLAHGGNRQALNVRPAFELAMEAVVDTDTFKSIFRTAVRKAHQGLLAGQARGTRLDLSESVAILASSAQLPDNARPGQQDKPALGKSLDDVTTRLADLHVWELRDWTSRLAVAGLGGSLAAAAAAVAVARDRRRMVRRVGWVTIVVGLVVVGAVLALEWYVGRVIDDRQLAAAVRQGLSRVLADVRSLGLWTAGYGVVLAAAASADRTERFSPSRAASLLTDWVRRRRATTSGTVVLGVVAIVAGLSLLRSPTFWLEVAVLATGLWLAYFGVIELLRLVHTRVPAPAGAADAPRGGVRRLVVTTAVTVALLAVASAGLVVTGRTAARGAEAAGAERCNGDESLCDLPLDKAAFPATHNSMSAAQYPNWLFPEHFKTIGGQLESGARALLFDTHYGVPSSARLPGSDQPLILTDRAAELVVTKSEDADPALVERAGTLAARAPRKADASRGIYLCHNFCEMGAITFASALDEIKSFVDTHPDDVVMAVIEDHTDPRETAAAIEASGLADRAYTLDPGKPLPTLGDMIRSGRNLLVFAEEGGPGAPPWYHRAYEHWFQETTYTFDQPSQMDCTPNRGQPDAPLFLINHWLAASPPDPGRAASVNKQAFLEDRIRRCLDQRGLLPNVVAVDFSERGGLFTTTRRINDERLGEERDNGPGKEPPTPSTSTPGPRRPESPVPAPPLATRPAATRVDVLTGGDPARFCARQAATYDLVGSWGIASLAATPSEAGLADFAFGPSAARALDALVPTAPAEIARLLGPTQERARAAVQAIRDLGVDAATVDALADAVELRAPDPDNDDPFAIRSDVLARLRAVVGDDRLNSARQAFAASHPESGLFDVGDVSDGAARVAGFDCLLQAGG